MSVAAPDPEECQNLLFKTLCRLRLFSPQPGLFTNSANLVAVAPAFGLIFAGTPTGFQVLQSNVIEEVQATRGETSDFPRRDINLGCFPSHLTISCDQAFLAVAYVQDGSPCAIIYLVTSFCSQNIAVATTIRLASSPGSRVLDFQFNPGLPQFLAACTSDGGVGVYELKGNSFGVSTLPSEVQATCLCWSPKGKQLVVGDSKGNISQFKPDLKVVKRYPPPPDKPSSALVNLLWISNTQFAGIYADTANPTERPVIMMVNVPKTGISYINFDDICYSGGELRPPQFYMVHQGKWNLIMVASANSMEVGVLAMKPDQSWVQWTQEDAARAELPLTPSKQETYPVGLALDSSSTRQLPWGENNSLHPMPMLHILSNDGVLCIFHVINIQPDAACVCEPPKPLPDTTGLSLFVAGPPMQALQPPQPSQPPVSSQPSQPSPGSSMSQASQPAQLFQPSQPTQPTSPAINLFQSAPAQTPTAPQQVSAASSDPLAQLASMGSQLQPTTKPSAFGALGMTGMGVASHQPQASFGLAGSASPSMGSSSFGLSQSPSLGSLAGLNVSKTTSSTFNPSSLQSMQPSVHPPSYSAPQVTPSQQPAPPEQSHRPSTLVPVPPVQNNGATTTTPRPQEIKPAGGAGDSAEEKTETIDPAVYVEHIQEEIRVFENEMGKLKRLVTQEIPPIGSEKDKRKLIRMSEDLDSFIMELRKSMEDLKHDVNEVKSVGMEATLWVEDAKSRLRQITKPSYLQLVKAQELDPVSARSLFNIQQKFNYVEIQLANISKQLSLEWSQFQEIRSPRSRLFVPTMDEIYQTMVKQNNILHRLKSILDDVSQRISARKLRNSNRIHLINDSALARKPARRLQLNDDDPSIKSDIDLSSLAENLLESQLKRRQSDDTDLEILAARALNLNLKKIPPILCTQKHLSNKKEDKLRELLLQLPMARIKADRTPSDMGLVGNRPCVSFSSSVLSISPRKPATLKTEQVTLSSAAPQPVTAGAPSLGVAVTSKVPTSQLQPGIGLFSASDAHSGFRASPSGQSAVSPAFSAAPIIPSTVAFSGVPKTTNSTAAPSFVPGSMKQPGVSPVQPLSTSTVPTAGLLSSSFKFPTPNIPQQTHSTPSTETATGAINFVMGSTGPVSKPSPQPISFGQGTSTAASSFVTPQSPSISSGSALSKAPTMSAAPKSGDSLSALSDMVNKAGAAVASPSRIFGTEVKQTSQPKTAASSSFSFNTVAKPVSASSTLPSTPIGSSSPIIVVGSAPSSKPGLLPTPNVSSIQNFLGNSITITPVTASSSPVSSAPAAAVATSTQSNSSSTDSTIATTSFFGGLPLGGSPIAPNKPVSSLFSGSATSFQTGKTVSLFSAPSTSATAPATSTAASSFSFSKIATPQSTAAINVGAASLFGFVSSPATSTIPSTSSSAFSFGSISSSPSSPQTSSAATAAAVPPAPQSTTSTAPALAVTATPPPTPPPTPVTATLPPPANSLLGQLPPSSSTVTPAATSGTTPALFGTPAAPATTTPVFGQTSVFGVPSSTTNTGAASPVGGTSSIFGGATAAPLFGGLSSVSATTSSTTPSLFEGTAAGSTTTSTATISTPSLFGSASATSSTGSGVPSSFSFALPSISGTSSEAATTTAATATISKPFSFALPSSTTTTSTATTSTASVFGSANATSSTGSSTASSFSFALPSISGTSSEAATTTAATAGTSKPFSFALAPSTTAGSPGSVFGGNAGSLFGGQTSTAATTQASFFGQSICSPSSTPASSASAGSVFGGGSSTVTAGGFATSSTATQPLFGQSSTTSAFGAKPSFPQSGGSLFGQGSTFGSPTASVFGGSSTSGSSIFGGGTSSPASGNLFQPAASSTGNIFGQAAASPTSGSFSSGAGGTVEQSGFGSPSSFGARQSGFGAPPAFGTPAQGGFGSGSAFGSPPAFGSSPAFGSAPAFGSPNRVFGSPGATPGFGSASPTQTNSTFEALATQNSGPTFGALASQDSAPTFGTLGAGSQPQPANPFGGTQPSAQFSNNTGSSFGGSSFTSWRR